MPEWQEYKQRNGLTGEFLSGPPLREYWRGQLKVHSRMLEVARSLRK